MKGVQNGRKSYLSWIQRPWPGAGTRFLLFKEQRQKNISTFQRRKTNQDRNGLLHLFTDTLPFQRRHIFIVSLPYNTLVAISLTAPNLCKMLKMQSSKKYRKIHVLCNGLPDVVNICIWLIDRWCVKVQIPSHENLWESLWLVVECLQIKR